MMRKIILSLCIITFLAYGCDKEKRTYNKIYGIYDLKTYTVNGSDSIIMYKDSLGTSFNFHYDDYYSYNICFIDGNRTDGKYYPITWKWELITDFSTLKIKTAYAYTGTGPFGNNITPEWEILKLKSDYLQLKTIYNNKEYIIELKEK